MVVGTAIEAERSHLLQAQSILSCAYQVLLYSEDDEALQCADTVKVVERMVGETIEGLDSVKLQSIIEPGKAAWRVEEPAVPYGYGTA